MTYAWFDVTRNAGIARTMHMSYRSKTYTWTDVILVKRSMIRGFFFVLALGTKVSQPYYECVIPPYILYKNVV